MMKALVAFTVVLWGAALAFPFEGGFFAWAGGVTASVAFMSAVATCYRNDDVVPTRGGLVYKKESPVRFFIAYLIIGILPFGLMLACLLGLVGQVTACSANVRFRVASVYCADSNGRVRPGADASTRYEW
jgi:hypothetical protein